MDKNIPEHIMTRHLVEIVAVPEHEKRIASKEFIDSKEQLIKDGHYTCWICGATEDLQVHHFACEWSLSNNCNFDKLKQICELFDIYGYGNAMKDIPMTSADDIRNMMVLCQKHHTHPTSGIHAITFPVWLSQKIEKDGVDIIPANDPCPSNINPDDEK